MKFKQAFSELVSRGGVYPAFLEYEGFAGRLSVLKHHTLNVIVIRSYTDSTHDSYLTVLYYTLGHWKAWEDYRIVVCNNEDDMSNIFNPKWREENDISDHDASIIFNQTNFTMTIKVLSEGNE